MAIIKSGASSAELTIDPTSSAARVTLYDSSGSEVRQTPSGSYIAPISARVNTGTSSLVSATHLTTSSSGTAATSYATASISPSGNKLVLAWVSSRIAAGTPAAPTLSGNGLTWVQVATVQFSGTTTRLTLFRAMAASPTSGAVTIDFSGVTQDTASWSISEFGNVNTSGTNGSGAVNQSATNSTAGATSLTVTLASASPTYSIAGGFATINGGTITPEAGFTELGEDIANTIDVESEWKFDNSGQDTTVSASWAGSVAAGGIALEIVSADNQLAVWLAVPTTKALYIRRVTGIVGFDGTAGVQYFSWYFTRASQPASAPSNATVLTPSKKRTSYGASTAAVYQNGEGLASVTGGSGYLGRWQVPDTSTGIVQPFDITFITPGDRTSPVVISTSETLALKLDASKKVGQFISGFVEWDEI